MVTNMTQKQLVLYYVQEHGSIIPAKMSGTIYKGKMMGSEISRRCRELRTEGKLRSEGVGKFEKYYSTEKKFVWDYSGDVAIKRYLE